MASRLDPPEGSRRRLPEATTPRCARRDQIWEIVLVLALFGALGAAGLLLKPPGSRAASQAPDALHSARPA